MSVNRREIVLRIPRSVGVGTIAVAIVTLSFWFGMSSAVAQKSQESFDSKFNITEDTAGVGIAASADGKYVYVVGPRGILVSEDHGRTGSWVQTVRLK